MSAVMQWGGALLLVAVLAVAAVAKVSPDPDFSVLRSAPLSLPRCLAGW